MPSPLWSVLAVAASLVPLTMLMYGITLANTPVHRHFAAMAARRIVLERGGCRYDCAGFKLTFDASGAVRYDGFGSVRYLGRYDARDGDCNFAPGAEKCDFARAADMFFRLGLFRARDEERVKIGAEFTSITITLGDGKTVRSRSYGKLDEIWAGAVMLEGTASHLCGWQPTGHVAIKKARDAYSPIRVAPCPLFTIRRI